jgi:hypothetical protein
MPPLNVPRNPSYSFWGTLLLCLGMLLTFSTDRYMKIGWAHWPTFIGPILGLLCSGGGVYLTLRHQRQQSLGKKLS